jgi:hypothetical protein
MVKNAISFFYPGETSTASCIPQMLNNLLTWSQEIIFANMKQSVSLTLKIFKSLYPRADLEVAGKLFAATCSDDDTLKVIEDSAMTAEHIVIMLPIDMSIG